jgi:hypothetical protein
MANSNIQTRTATFTTAYTTMAQSSRDSLTILSAGSAMYVSTGTALEDATDALAITLPAGAGIVLEPAPTGPVHIRLTNGGPVSYWFT